MTGTGHPHADRDAPGPDDAAPAVRTRGLAVGHAGVAVVGGLDLSLERGRVLALVGSNGSGKSTVLKTLVGLLEPVEGELDLFGTRASRRQDARRGRVAYLGQFHTERTPLPLRARDVVRMGRFARLGLWRRPGHADDDAVERAMERMGITALADAAVRSLSGGQRQRVYLAQVLASEADLLLLDEPTAGLDAPGHERYEAAVVAEVARGASVVVATHDIGEAARADQVLLLARRVVAYGPPADVLRADHLLETFGIALRDVDGLLLRTGDDHGHDHPPGPDGHHGHEH